MSSSSSSSNDFVSNDSSCKSPLQHTPQTDVAVFRENPRCWRFRNVSSPRKPIIKPVFLRKRLVVYRVQSYGQGEHFVDASKRAFMRARALNTSASNQLSPAGIISARRFKTFPNGCRKNFYTIFYGRGDRNQVKIDIILSHESCYLFSYGVNIRIHHFSHIYCDFCRIAKLPEYSLPAYKNNQKN